MCMQIGNVGFIDENTYIFDENAILHNGDSYKILKELPSNSVASIVTDPPYGLEFMGKSWDKVLPPVKIWRECIRVLKPGGYLVAMSASRTYHRLAVQLEGLGLICHPMIGWLYGSGFPKATDLSKQFDKQAGAERIKKPNPLAKKQTAQIKGKGLSGAKSSVDSIEPNPSTESANTWNGYKYGLQSLKPALEPIAVFQKPHLKPMTDNIINYGVGAMNIDECRVEVAEAEAEAFAKEWDRDQSKQKGPVEFKGLNEINLSNHRPTGRHPANLLHDGSDSVEQVFLDQGGITKSSGNRNGEVVNSKARSWKNTSIDGIAHIDHNDQGTASRFFNKLPITDLDAPFFYTAKPSKSERNKGLNDLDKKHFQTMGTGVGGLPAEYTSPQQNYHPTVKPVSLMEWLIKLVTPPGETTIDPFTGSGTSGVAARLLNRKFIGIEREKEYFEIARARIESTDVRQC